MTLKVSPSIILPGQSPGQQQMRLTGEKTLDGGFRLVLHKPDKQEYIDLSPAQTEQMAIAMLNAIGIMVQIGDLPH